MIGTLAAKTKGFLNLRAEAKQHLNDLVKEGFDGALRDAQALVDRHVHGLKQEVVSQFQSEAAKLGLQDTVKVEKVLEALELGEAPLGAFCSACKMPEPAETFLRQLGQPQMDSHVIRKVIKTALDEAGVSSDTSRTSLVATGVSVSKR